MPSSCSRSSLSGPAHATSANDFLYRNSEPDGSGLPYRVFIPAGCEAPARCPVILFLHGAGERGSNNTSQLNNRANYAMELVDGANLTAEPMLMIAPQCPTGVDWGNTANQTFIADILEDVAEEFGYDETTSLCHRALHGRQRHLDDAEELHDLLCRRCPDLRLGIDSRFVGVVLGPPVDLPRRQRPNGGGRRFAKHGGRAPRRGGDPIYTEFASGGHGIWDNVYPLPEVFDWMRAHRAGVRDRFRPSSESPIQPHEAAWGTTGTEITLSGTAGDPGAATTQVSWSADWGASGTAAGTTSWTTGPVTLPSGSGRIRIEAEGTSFVASLGGASIYSDSLAATSTSASNQPPRVVIGGPALGQRRRRSRSACLGH